MNLRCHACMERDAEHIYHLKYRGGEILVCLCDQCYTVGGLVVALSNPERYDRDYLSKIRLGESDEQRER